MGSLCVKGNAMIEQMNHWLRLISVFLIIVVWDAKDLTAAYADNSPESESEASGSETQTAPQSKMLNGSVEDQEKMQRSLKLLLSPPDSNKSAPHPESHVQQFSGGQTYSPGQPAPPVPHIVPPSPQHFHASATIESRPPRDPISIIFPEHS